MAREVETDTSFTQSIEISGRIEHIHIQGREETSDKKPHHFGGFNGASFGGMGHFGRGHDIRLQVAMVLMVPAQGSHHMMYLQLKIL